MKAIGTMHTWGHKMENEYAKKYTTERIERTTRWLLYYMGKTAERLQQGETPVLYLGEIVKHAANLQTYYSRADDLEIWENLDFVEIYKKALEQAKQEIKND